MKITKILLAILLGLFVASCKTGGGGGVAVIETEHGTIKFKLLGDVAPKHVENFKKLAQEGFYNGLGFHRSVPNLLIQGGDPNTRGDDRRTWGMGQPGQPTVPAEFSNKPFARGTVGAARTSDPNSASSQFFICLREFPQWNGQYTVFGEVIEGIEVVEKIAALPTQPGDPGSKLLSKVVMNKVSIQD